MMHHSLGGVAVDGASSSSMLPPPRHQHSASASSAIPSSYTAHQNGSGTNGYSQHHQPMMMMSSSLHFPPMQQQQEMSGPMMLSTGPIVTQQPATSFDPRNLEIKTRSVEQTLLPLVQQISTLVTFQKESIITGGRPKSERALRAALKIGTAVEAAVERFVAVGETIADENPDIQPELYDACNEARIAGSSIANLHNTMLEEPHHENGTGPKEDATVNSTQLVRAARQLLYSVTRVLLLADRVLVKHILRAEDKIAYSLTKLEHTSNFTEFVQIFTEFGSQMVDLAHRSGDRQQDLKSEKRRAQMQVARAQLERLTMLLLTSSKTLLRHPDDPAARQCRDGVFHQIRSALQLIAICVTDGVLPIDVNTAYPSPLDEMSRARDGPLDIGIQLTSSVAIRQLCEMMSLIGMMPLIGSGVRERLVAALDALCEMSADFTESAWTPLQQREQILDLLEECRFEMGNLVSPPHNEPSGAGGEPSEEQQMLQSGSIEVTVERLNRRLKDLRKQLQVVALEQIATVFRQNDDQSILSSLKTCSISGDIDGVERFLEQFRLHAEHLQEVCRLLHHISLTDALHVFTGHAERNLRALAPLTLLAGRVLCVHPSSRIARENLEVFCDTWATNVNDLARMSKELDAACSGRLAAEKQAYMSLPRPGVSSSSSSSASVCGGFVGLVQPILFGGMSSSCHNGAVFGGGAVPFCPQPQPFGASHWAAHFSKPDQRMAQMMEPPPPAPIPRIGTQKLPNSDSGFSQMSGPTVTDGSISPKEKKEDAKKKKSSIGSGITSLLRRIRREPSADNRKLAKQSDGGAERPRSTDGVRREVREAEIAFAQSSRSLKQDLGRKNEEDEENCSNGLGQHSPLYATIMKEQRNGTTSPTNSNSAFTPYTEFQQRQQGRNLPLKTPPRPRRQMPGNEQQPNGSSGVKFNRIGTRNSEPVIVRQREVGELVVKQREETNHQNKATNMHSNNDFSSVRGGGPFAELEARDEQHDEEDPIESGNSNVVLNPLYAQRLRAAPLAMWDEAEEEVEPNENEKRNGLDRNGVGPEHGEEEESDFVVRMRAKKAARLALQSSPTQTLIFGEGETAGRGGRFEQRISQILESLQQEAESLIRIK